MQSIFDILTQPGERLPAISRWLLDEVWSDERYLKLAPSDYLNEGEKDVYLAEELILSSAPTVYDEITVASVKAPSLNDFFRDRPAAIVVLDGASIREVPLLRRLAGDTGFTVVECGVSFAGLPSETLDFVEQRIIGKRVAPSDLPKRQELRSKNICAVYYDAPTRMVTLSRDHASYFLWSRFPDGMYKDMGSKFAAYFSELQRLYDTVWKNIVLEIPRGRIVAITSDHGYTFFGTGLESSRFSDAAKLLSQDRYKRFGNGEAMPTGNDGLQIVGEKRLAMLRGRIKNKPMGQSANNAYRHGGMSLMEMLTPWLVLQRM